MKLRTKATWGFVAMLALACALVVPGMAFAAIPLDGEGVTVTAEKSLFKGEPVDAVVVKYKADADSKAKTLVKDADYTVAYTDNDKVGTASYTVTGIGEYEGEVSGTFEITDVMLTLKLNGAKAKDYKLSDLEALADTDPQFYLNSKGGYTVTAVTKYVTMADLLDDAGLAAYWDKGASFEYTCSDGPYTKDKPTYEDAIAGKFFPNISAADESNDTGAIDAPMVYALAYGQADAGDGKLSDATQNAIDKTKDVDGFGRVYRGSTATSEVGGNRFPSGVTEINVVSDKVLEVRLNGEAVRSYTTDDLAPMLRDDTYYYQYGNNVAAATNYVALDTLLTASGLSGAWKEGAKIVLSTPDWPDGFTKGGAGSYGTYEQYTTNIYTYPNYSATDTKNTTGALEVPVILAFDYGTNGIGDATVADAVGTAEAKIATHTLPRIFCGYIAGDDGAISAPGWRLVTDIIAIDLQVTPASDVFTDVPENAWYASAATLMSASGLIKGKTATTFAPNDKMTRAQLAAILWRYAEPEAEAAYDAKSAKNETGMSDVKDGYWYTGAANWAVANKVINGSNGKFLPDQALDRQTMIAIIGNFVKADTANADTAKMDEMPDANKVSSWFKSSVAWALNMEVIHGVDRDGASYIDPTATLPRCQAAAIIANALTRGLM